MFAFPKGFFSLPPIKQNVHLQSQRSLIRRTRFFKHDTDTCRQQTLKSLFPYSNLNFNFSFLSFAIVFCLVLPLLRQLSSIKPQEDEATQKNPLRRPPWVNHSSVNRSLTLKRSGTRGAKTIQLTPTIVATHQAYFCHVFALLDFFLACKKQQSGLQFSLIREKILLNFSSTLWDSILARPRPALKRLQLVAMLEKNSWPRSA